MWLAVAGVWAAVVLTLGEIGFPMDFTKAIDALAANAGAMQPLFSWRGLVGAAFSFFGSVWAVGIFSLLQISSFEIGRQGGFWLDGSRGPGSPPGFRILLLGWVAAGLALMGLGLVGLFRFLPAALLAMVPLASGMRTLVREFPRFSSLGCFKGFLTRLGRWALILVLFPAAISLLAPATDHESLTHSLAIPARWAGLGKLLSQDGNPYFDLPGHARLLAGWGLLLGGEATARLWPLGALLAGAGIIAGTVRKNAPGISCWAAFALVATISPLIQMAREGNPVVSAVPFALAAGILVFRLFTGNPHRFNGSVWAGLMVGVAVGCWLPALAVIMPVPALFILAGGGKRRFRALFYFVLGGAACAGPWLIKSALLAGSPFHPLGAGSLGNAAAAAHLYFSGVHSSLDGAPMILESMWGIGRIWLTALPLALISSKRAKSWWLAGALGGVLSLVFSPGYDLAVPAAAWLVTAAVISAEDLAVRCGKAPMGLRSILAAVIVLQAAQTTLDTLISQGIPAGLGLENRRSHFGRMRPALASALEKLKSSSPRNARVLVIGEDRGYPRVRDFMVSSPHEAPPLYELVKASPTLHQIARRMKQVGASYILHNHVAEVDSRHRQKGYSWTSRDLSVWSAYWRQHARLIASPVRIGTDEGGFYLYRLGTRRHELNVTPTLPGIAGQLYRVDELRAEGKFEDMAEQLRILEGIAGDFPEVKFFIGDFWAGQDPYKSWEYLRDADAGNLCDISLWRDLAYQAEQRWRLEDALEYHEKIAHYSPGEPGKRHRRVLLKLSRQSAKLGRLRRAEKYLLRAVTLFPGDAPLWAELSEIYLSQRRRIEADGALVQALKLDPRNREYRRALNRIRRKPRGSG